jgi:DNA-binding winged helix-turn-helix (wHTH) protein
LSVSSEVRFVFDHFELDPARRRLAAGGEPIAISERQLDVLLSLVERAGQILSKDDLLQAGWQGVAVGDNSVEQAISTLRRLLGTYATGVTYIETVARRGYRFTVDVTRVAARASDARLHAMLAPHRAFIEGRAALETLAADGVGRARHVFEDAVRRAPEHASAHVGLANACIMQFEMCRADPVRDTAALALSIDQAREGCRLDPQSGEAWATLGFVLYRTGDGLEARAAVNRAVMLEPDNWRHYLRLSSVSWGEERLRAAHRTLKLLPDCPLAHWLAATVYVARGVFGEAERELVAGLGPTDQPSGRARFSTVALHWMRGLIHLAGGDDIRALEAFERELSSESAGQLYARECAANTWYAIGALRLRQDRTADARVAFARAIERVASHPMACAGLAAIGALDRVPALPVAASPVPIGGRTTSLDAAVFQAAGLAVAGAHGEAARIVDGALAAVDGGDAGWLIPIEPLLQVTAHADIWSRPLARLRNRAA